MIVPNEAWTISLLIGQPFVNNYAVTLVIQGELVKFFNSKTWNAAQLETIEPRLLPLWAYEATVIPPDHIGHVLVTAGNRLHGNKRYLCEVRVPNEGRT